MSRSLWRELLYKEISKLELQGSVLDLGGSRKSAYQNLIKGEPEFKVVNIDTDQGADFSFDLEGRFETVDSSFDNVLCLNVMEHIFNYQNLLAESFRTLKPGGKIILAVPFLIQIHPSPRDHWRFTKETLERIFNQAGFKEVHVQSIGTGIFGASHQLFHSLYKFGFVQFFFKTLAKFGDKTISFLKPKSHFSKEFYPLGYIVTATK